MAFKGYSLFLACLFCIAYTVVNGYTTSSTCNASTENQFVCISCQSVGQCKAYDDGSGTLQYYVVQTQDCSATTQYCSVNSANTGSCEDALLDINCLCTQGIDAGVCKQDPYGSDSAFIDCTATTSSSSSTEWVQCLDYQSADSASCSCQNPVCPSQCGVYMEPNMDGCSKFYTCDTGSFIETSCADGCYDTATCTCSDENCPTCGYILDTTDPSGSGYINCGSTSPVKGSCGDLQFDQVTCTCVPFGGGGTTCPACGSVSTYGPDCSDYYDCQTSPWQSYSCLNPDHCFNEVTCMCVDCPTCGRRAVEGSWHEYVECSSGTDSGVLSCGTDFFDPIHCSCRTCPACGSVDDHIDTSCGGYIYCGSLTTTPIAQSCPNADFCYNPVTCACEPAVNDDCPECGYKADPNDSSGYFQCTQDGSVPDIPGSCGAGYVWDAAACECA